MWPMSPIDAVFELYIAWEGGTVPVEIVPPVASPSITVRHRWMRLLDVSRLTAVVLAASTPALAAAPPAGAQASAYAAQPDTRSSIPMAPADATPAPYRYGDSKHTDLSGVWVIQGLAGVPVAKVPLTATYAAKLARTRSLSDAGTPESDSVSTCIAYGMPRFMIMPFELNQMPGEIVMVSAGLTDVRRIYIDGRGHSNDFEPSYNGDSIAHWEGPVLVVETNNMVAGTMEQYGTPYSDKISIVERFRRTAPNTLEVVTTLTDPKALSRPWTSTRIYKLMAEGSRLEEDRCVNNRNAGPDGLQDAVVGKKTGG